MRKILAIDDQADNLATIVAVLKIHISDCIFFTALTGKEGLDIANKEQPDVILLEMDGYEICKRLKDNLLTKHIPVIMVTAINADSESRIRGLNAGADAFLSKPIDAIELSAQVNVMLRIKKAEDELRTHKEALNLQVIKQTKEFRESEEKYRSVFEGASDGLILITRNLEVVDVNPAFSEITDIPRGKIIGKSGFYLAKKYVSTKQLPSILKMLGNLMLNQIERPFELIFNNKTLEISTRKQDNEKIVAVIRDITYLVKETKLKRENEEYFRTLIENSSNVIAIVDQQGLISYKSPSLKKVLGYLPNKIIGKNIFDFIHIDDKQRVINQFKNLFKKANKIEKIDFNFLHCNGKYCSIKGTAKNLLYSPKIKGLVLNYRDVTPYKKAENALKESERMLQTLFNNLQGIVYKCKNDDDWSMEFISAGFYKMTSYSVDDLIGNSKISFNQIIVPEDRNTVRDKINLALKNNEKFELNYRIKCATGEIKFVLEKGEGVYSEETGEAIGVEGFITDVTQQRKTELSLQLKKEELLDFNKELEQQIIIHKKAKEEIFKLSTAVKQSPSVITITNLDGNIEYVNPKFTEITGYKSEEVINENPRILKSEIKHNEEYQELWDAITIGKEWHGEFYNRKKNGEFYWESASISPIFDDNGKITSYIKIGEDITHRKRNELIQKVLYNISNAVSTADNLKKLINFIKQQLETIIDVSNFFVAFYDKETDTFSSSFMNDDENNYETWPAGKTFSAYVVKTSKSLFVDENQILQMKERGDIEIVGAVPKVGMIVPIKYEGITNGVFSIQNYTDADAYSESDLEMLDFVSDLISLYINRINALEKLKSALNKATESDRLKTAFLQNVSHEIRTPMNGILGFTSLLNDPDLSGEEQQSYINIITISGKRMLSTLNDLMDISMLETGQVKINLTSTNINDELDNLYSFFKPEVENKGMDLNYSVSLEKEFVNINIDRDKFYAILSNLIKNSIKYSKKGSINFGYEYKEDFLEFFVKDTGIGIPKNRQEAIFKRFVQADIEDIKVYEGAGLGLSISKAYVEMLGGEIWVNSLEGKGAEFYFTIPYNSGHKKILENSNEDMFNNKETETVRLKILIVEDEEIASEYLSIILGVFNPTLLFARTGIEAISICKENLDIDLVLMDIKMPIMGGYEATREIRVFNKKVVIIAQTAYALGGDREKAISAGCDDYVIKPIDSEKLIKKIESYFSDRLK